MTTIASGAVVQTCSRRYLVCLAQEAFRAKALSFQTQDSQHISNQRARLAFLEKEFRRLLEHPDLFESESARLRFFSLLLFETQFYLGRASLELLRRACIRNLHAEWVGFKIGEESKNNLKPWEMWLKNYAPGFTKHRPNLPQTIPKSSVQVLTPVCMRLIHQYADEELVLLRLMRDV